MPRIRKRKIQRRNVLFVRNRIPVKDVLDAGVRGIVGENVKSIIGLNIRRNANRKRKLKLDKINVFHTISDIRRLGKIKNLTATFIFDNKI